MLTFDQAHLGKRLVFPSRMAAGRGGEKLTGRLTFWVYHLVDGDELTIDINGQALHDVGCDAGCVTPSA